MSVCRYALDVEVLACVKLNAGQENKGELRRMLVDCFEDLLGRKNWMARITWFEQDHCFGWVESVVDDLRFDGVLLLCG